MALSANELFFCQITDSHPRIRIGGPVVRIGGPVAQMPTSNANLNCP